MPLEILQFLWTVTGLFHSSRFSTFPKGVEEELPRLGKCSGKIGEPKHF